MALKALNSVAGFSVGEVPSIIINSNGNVSANFLDVSSVSNLGLIGNVKITGGASGQVISTDGTGNLSFISVSSTSISNGTSNVNIPTLNGNVVISVGGTPNVLTVTSSNIVVSGEVSAGNVIANGNVSANNYIVTPVSTDLIVAPGTQITRIYANLNPYSTDTYDIGNTLARWNNLFANTANFSGNVKSLNADLGNLATANYVNVAGNTISNNLTVNSEFAANTANFDGNVIMDNWLTVTNTANVGNLRTNNLLYANGVAWDLGGNPAGSNTYIQYNDGAGNFGASGNLKFDYSTSKLQLNGDILLGGTEQNQIVNLSNTSIEIRGGWNNAAGTGASLVAGDYANSSNWGKIGIQGNYSGNSVGFAEANAFIFTNPGYGAGNVLKIDILNTTTTSNASGLIQANGGMGVKGNVYIAENLVVQGNIGNANNVSITNDLQGNTANFSGNVTSLNANLGNLATANYVNVANQINGNIGNFSGNITALNATLGNLATANYVNVANEINGNIGNFSGNVSGLNLIGPLANGTSSVKVYQDANVEISIDGTANVASFSSAGLYVDGEINTTTGNMLSNGNVTANGFLNSANANVTGEGLFGSINTANITATTNTITISAAGTNENVVLAPTGSGTVSVSGKRITQLDTPAGPSDAATKEYVDTFAGQGLTIHTPVLVEANSALNATYLVGGTTQTTTDITGGKTITFSTNHGLSVNDGIVWDNSFNGIIGGEAYWVNSIPALNQITIRDGYFGVEVTTLTNGTGLSQNSRANPGVNATLTNAGTNVALSLDSVALANGDRVLVYNQANSAHNGIYVVSDIGNVSAAWVLTRSTDMDKYVPSSTTGMSSGDYFFIQSGATAAGESYVLSSPVGEIVIGTDNIQFTQFSAAGSYTAGNGISIAGTIISANVDNTTTAIVSGNIVVKSSAVFTTPNVGDATFSSLTWNTAGNGNITANNLSVGNLANVTGNLTIQGNVQANGTISSNANISGNNITTSNEVSATGNVTGGNLVTLNTVFAANANLTSTLTSNSVNVNLELSGNTANFTGNLRSNNLTVNLELSGNTANFTGNLRSNNLTVNLEFSANTANFDGNVIMDNWLTVANTANVGNLRTDNLLYANGTAWDLQQAAGSNTEIQYNNGSNNFGASANLTFDYSTNKLNINGTANVANNVTLGNTAIEWGTVTTTSITANQTIASVPVSGITGVEFLVKGVDSTGAKYSVATVQAVTDGSNVDYSTFGTVYLGGTTGALAVNISGGYVRLQTTPSSSNSTVWVTQVRTI